MTDFETHPAGTAARIAELEAALTRANAAAAAAYKVAAKAVDEAHVFASGDTYDETVAKVIALGCAGKAIRALATPDQTAAMDKLIAEAEARGMKRAAEIADAKYAAGEMGNPGHHILAASKKGGV